MNKLLALYRLSTVDDCSCRWRIFSNEIGFWFFSRVSVTQLKCVRVSCSAVRVEEKFDSRWPSTTTTQKIESRQIGDCVTLCTPNSSIKIDDAGTTIHQFFFSVFISGEFNCAQCQRSFIGLPITLAGQSERKKKSVICVWTHRHNQIQFKTKTIAVPKRSIS